MNRFPGLLAVFLLLLVAGCRAGEPLPSLSEESTLAYLPPPAGVLDVIAFGSCASEDQPQPFWDPILAHNPDLYLFIGDNVYADTDDMGEMRRAYGQLAAQPGYQRLVQTTPVLATWDDHDYGLNDGGADYPAREGAQREFLQFFEVDETSPRWEQPGIYDAQLLGEEGQHVQVILLDTRYFRGPLRRRPEGDYEWPGPYIPSDDTTATMLGEAQWTWLEEQLRQPADVRILVSSIQVVPEDHYWEKWANMPHERERLFRLIRETGAGGVILLSGDRHLAEISRLPADVASGVGYPLYDVTSSGLNRGGGGSAEEPNSYRIGPGNFRSNNYGLITIDWSEDDPTIRLEVYDDVGELGLQHIVRLSELQPPS